MSIHKRYRQGQILKLLAAHAVASQDELRRHLGHIGMRVTQATLSRDLRELRLVKTAGGYRPLSAAAAEEAAPQATLARALKEFLLDIRPAQNMLVLKTPPGGAQPLAAAVDSERWKEIVRHTRRRRHGSADYSFPRRPGSGAKARGGIAPMNDPLRVAVVGATGYAGYELARLLLRHPKIDKPTFYLRDGNANVRCLTELYPQLRGWGEAPCKPLSVAAIAKSGADVVFLSTPHEASLELVPELLAANPKLRIVDLSGAFRFREPHAFERWYKLAPAAKEILKQAVYGLPELYAKSLPEARLVANPGCYPTSVILGLRPLIEAGWIDVARGIVCDCKSGVSGAGKEPKRETHFVEVNENFRAYGLFTHRHTPEVAEHLGLAERDFVFTTHLLPVERGILSTLYVWLKPTRNSEEVETLYQQFYAERPMVRVLPGGRLPELQHVAHTNFCDVGFALESKGERLVIVSCLDNLGKGAAGQAVQNLNGMFGYPETAGLI